MTKKSPDPVMTATEVVERLEALNAAIRERESIIRNSVGDKITTLMADLVIKHLGDDLSPDDLAQIIAIRDGKND